MRVYKLLYLLAYLLNPVTVRTMYNRACRCQDIFGQQVYRVGQKSKLLILSEHVNETEKTGGM